MNRITIQIIILSGTMLINSHTIFGQERIVHGKVTTFENTALIGAKIKVKSTKQVVRSDTLGRFSVSCHPKDKLIVSAHGFITQHVKVDEIIKVVFVNLSLKSNPKSRDVAVGYGHVKESDNLMPVSSLRKRDLDFSQFTDIYEIITGRFPGVQIVNGEIIVQGRHTLLGSDAALLVVDGMVVDESTFSSIPTTNIARIDVLKGPAASVYGVRGANGVVMVETKRGGEQ
jgi:TonB-dependent SusC/RagA subfamily outer membrane receptor